MMIFVLSPILILGVSGYIYMSRPIFGALPKNERLALVKKSPHYRDGRFRNLEEKPTITEGYSIFGLITNFLFKNYPDRDPRDSMPSLKTNLKTLSAESNVVVWFGHSSFFIQLDGVRILVDPIFSGRASPLPFGVKAYKGSDIYTVEDMPAIDYMLLSHDHYDHLDYKTAKALQPKVKHVVCGLGAGGHYQRWGYTPNQIIEKDWYQSVDVKTGFSIFTESTHHDSGRGFKSGQALWLSFYIQSQKFNIYYSGDGGYSNRFKEIAEKYRPIDLAIMECGQYNKAWQSVHELPEEVAQATAELNAKNLLTVHHSKFSLANHPWYEPLEEITKHSQNKSYRLITPMIGESVNLDNNAQVFKQWWKGLR